MAFLDSRHKKKSFVITLFLHLALLFLLFYFALPADEEPEGGIAINFGTETFGSGKVQPTKSIKSSPTKTVEKSELIPEAVTDKAADIKEDVVTQDTEDAPVLKKSLNKNKIQEVPKEKPKKVIETSKKKPVKELPKKKKPVEKEAPKPDKATTDALDSFLNGPKKNGESKGGEGDDQKAGDKGAVNGDPNAQSYYGNGKGLDGDGNYRLGGRKALNKEKIVQDCNESGIVVVKIEVNQAGKVIRATPGVKGTTNNAACLLDPARRAALATKFNSDTKAPSKQVGSIRYQFKLSE